MQLTSCWFSVLQHLTVHSHGTCCPPGPPSLFPQSWSQPGLYSYYLFIPGLCVTRRKTLHLSLLGFISFLLAHSSRPLQGLPAACLGAIFQVTYKDIKFRHIALFLWSLYSHCINCVKIFHSLSSLRSKDQDTKGCEAQKREDGKMFQLGTVDQKPEKMGGLSGKWKADIGHRELKKKGWELRVENCVSCDDVTRTSSSYWNMALVPKHEEENTQLQWELWQLKVWVRSEAVKAEPGQPNVWERRLWGAFVMVWIEKGVTGEQSHSKTWWGWIGEAGSKGLSWVRESLKLQQ